jgi:small multidrug resistance pump
MSAGSLQHLHAGPGAKLPQPAQRQRRVTHWLLLFVAIVAEVVATSTLKATEGFTRLWPSVIVVVCYETAFILMSLSMKKIPVGIVYAVWSGVGVALITLAAWIFLGQTLDAAGLAGVALIVGGVVVINAFSKSVVD